MKKFASEKALIPVWLSLLALPLVWFSGTTWESDSDDLIPTLISIENWRFFFWGHSRFGTLVPLLAKPFTDMKTNLLVQNYIHAISLIIFAFAIAKVFYRYRGKSATRMNIYMLLILIFCLLNPTYLKHLISGLPYAAPLGLFGICLLLIHSKLGNSIVYPLNAILIAISCWINPLNGYYLFPLLLALIGVKKYRNIYRELALGYFLLTFGIFFIVLGLANGEISGTVAPSFAAFHVYNWWLSLFLIQIALVIWALVRKEFRRHNSIYCGFAITWISVLALSILRHINLNQYAPRYFITGTFVSMCLTMIVVEGEISRSQKVQKVALRIANFLRIKLLLVLTLIALMLANIYIVTNLSRDYPLKEPHKTLMASLFADTQEPFTFSSGDFWYTWPTKLFVSNPEDIFVTSFETQFQYDVNSDSKKTIQSRFKDGDLGLCFGQLNECNDQIKSAVYRMYGAFDVKVETFDSKLLAKKPTLVHSLRLKITLK